MVAFNQPAPWNMFSRGSKQFFGAPSTFSAPRVLSVSLSTPICIAGSIGLLPAHCAEDVERKMDPNKGYHGSLDLFYPVCDRLSAGAGFFPPPYYTAKI